MAVENGKQISLPETVFTFDCHPKERLIVSGLITGKIFLHMYSLEASEESRAEPPGVKLYKHKESCRTLKFSPKGNVIYSGSSDRSLVAIDLGAGRVVHQVKEAHTSPLYSMHVLSERLVTTGDDKGCIKLWDSRIFKCVMELKENDEFISDFASSIERNTLLATSGDGRMVAVDLRKKGMDEKSDQMESELLCVEVIKGGQKVVVGDGEGVLGLFHWGLWGDVTDRFPCQSLSIDSMVKITEDVVCTGCMDGSIRSCRLLPNQVLNQVGCHGNGLPVTNLLVTHNKDHVLSCSENVIKFWDLESVYRARCSSDGGVSKYISGEREEGDCSDLDSDEELPKKKKRKSKKNMDHSTANQVHRKKTLDFFSDL